MEKYLVIIILFILAYYLFNCWVENKVNNILKTKEGFAGTTGDVDDVRVNSINTLAQITTGLKTGKGLQIQGALNIKDVINADSGITSKGNINTDGTINSNGAITTKGNISADGIITANKNLAVNGMLSVSSSGDDKIQNPTNNLRINNRGIQFGGVNNGREINSAQITAGLHADNSLCIVGMSTGKNENTRKVTAWAEGGFKVIGPLVVNNTDILAKLIDIKNKAIFHGNKMVFHHVDNPSVCADLGRMHTCGSNEANIWSIATVKKI